MMEIYKRMAEASKAIRAIAKADVNRAQNFKFRGIDAVYNGVHEALSANGIFCVPRVIQIIKEKEITTSKGGIGVHMVLEIEYAFFAPDGSAVKALTWGEGIDYGDKCINKCMSIAHKYALLQIFTIPTEESIDPDSTSYEVVGKEVHKPDDKIGEMCRYLSEFGVSPRELELYIKKPLDSMIDQDFLIVRQLAAELRSGKAFSVILSERESAKTKIANL